MNTKYNPKNTMQPILCILLQTYKLSNNWLIMVTGKIIRYKIRTGSFIAECVSSCKKRRDSYHRVNVLESKYNSPLEGMNVTRSQALKNVKR